MMKSGDRILVVKLADIGDAVLALPAIQALRSTYPRSQIDVLTTNAGANVFELSSAVDDVLTIAKEQFDRMSGLISPSRLFELARLAIALRRRRYQAVIILHHLTTAFGARKFRALSRVVGAGTVAGLDNGCGTFLTHRAIDYGFGEFPEWRYGLNVIEACGCSPEESRPTLTPPPAALASSCEMLKNAGITGPFAVLHSEVGEFSPARAWPDEYFSSVARRIVNAHQLPVVLVGTERNRPGLELIADTPGVFNLVGRTSFTELCAVVQNSSLVVGCDSSVSHLAGAFDRSGVALFGPSNIRAWLPYGADQRKIGLDGGDVTGLVALSLELPCSPCLYTGFRLGRPLGCRSRTCMTGLTPEHVSDVIDGLIQPRR